MTRVPSLAAAVAAVVLSTVAPAQAFAAEGRDPLTGRLLVTVERDTRQATASAAAASALAASAGARATGPRVPEIGLVTVRPRAHRTAAQVARALRTNPAVRRVEPERRHTLRLQPSDPALTAPEAASGTAPGTPVQWWAARSNLPQAWDVTRGDGALVAVIDTGADIAHPELAGKVAAAVVPQGTVVPAPAGVDENGHGTHVASVACAAADNGVGLAGAGLDCALLVVKSDLSDASVAASIVEATRRGAHAINMSFGTDGRRPAAQAVVDAIDFAWRHDVVPVAAAAETGDAVAPEEQGDPANVLQPTGTAADLTEGRGLSVTAAAADDARAVFAGRGTQISMAAYGAYDDRDGPAGLFGAFPANETDLERGRPFAATGFQPPCGCRTAFGGDGRYAYLQGTSMAAPQVTAMAALARRLNPDLKAADVVRLLKATARRAPGQGWRPDLGWGILDGGAALRRAQAVDRRPPTSRLTAPRRTHGRTLTLRFSGRDAAPPGLTPSGVERYEVWRSARGRRARRIATTSRTSLRVRTRPDTRYAFFTLAVDRAGNREAPPARPDATTRALPRP